MSAASILFRRDLRAMFSTPLSLFFLCIFWALCGWSFACMAGASSAGRFQLQTIWANAIEFGLPFFCAFAGALAFYLDGSESTLEVELASPVLERDLVSGKFRASFAFVSFAIIATLLMPAVFLPMVVPECEVRLIAFLPAVAILVLQAAAWTATGVFAGVFCKGHLRGTLLAVLLCKGLVVAWHYVGMRMFPQWRAVATSIPTDAHVLDFSTGLFSSATLLIYILATWLALFCASKSLLLRRLRG